MAFWTIRRPSGLLAVRSVTARSIRLYAVGSERGYLPCSSPSLPLIKDTLASSWPSLTHRTALRAVCSCSLRMGAAHRRHGAHRQLQLCSSRLWPSMHTSCRRSVGPHHAGRARRQSVISFLPLPILKLRPAWLDWVESSIAGSRGQSLLRELIARGSMASAPPPPFPPVPVRPAAPEVTSVLHL